MIFSPGEWYSCRESAVVASSGEWTLRFNISKQKIKQDMKMTIQIIITSLANEFVFLVMFWFVLWWCG